MFERLDFQTPRQPDESSSRILRRWQADICSVVQERWETLIPEQIKLSPLSIHPATERKLMQDLPGDSMGAHLEIGAEKIPSLLTTSGRLSRTLVENVLNIQGEDWPEPGKMSAGELAILEILYENFNDSVRESWSGTEMIPSRFVSIHLKPGRSRLFSTGIDLLVMKFRVETKYGEEELSWLMQKQQIEELIAKEFDIHIKPAHDSLKQMTELTEKIPSEVVVKLGAAELKMSEAAGLAAGDVLLLDQSIRKPLTAFVSSQPKWKVNPVTVGTRIGFQVVSLIED